MGAGPWGRAQESRWAASEILAVADLSQRIQVLRRLIEVAKECLDANNFYSVFAIGAGLALHPVARLKKTWAVRSPHGASVAAGGRGGGGPE